MYKSFQDIPQFPFASYHVNIGWDYLLNWIEDQKTSPSNKFDMNPPYQRGYVWTQEQKERYIEYRLRGGFSGKDIFWNCPGWMRHSKANNPVLELVDGKQRIDAVLEFMDNKVMAFGKYRDEYAGKLHVIRHDFIFHINNLETEKEVVEWYLGLNRGGSIHTDEDLRPAYKMLEKYKPNTPPTTD